MNYNYARLNKNKVVELFDTDYPLESTDSNEWLEVSHANPSPKLGWLYDKELGLFGPMTQETIILCEAKLSAKAAIDAAAGQARSLYITDIPGQSEIYREKYDQALDFLSCNGTVKYTDYPMLEVEARILDIPMKIIAETVIKCRSLWITKLAAIEELRLHGKYNVEHCYTMKDLAKLKANIIHQLNDLK